MTARHAPGATFGVSLDGKEVWVEGFGLADVENGVPATPETVYRTASIGKSMTATGAMKLVEEGKLELDVPIQKYAPRFPQKPWPITTRDLISMTSGIRHYEVGPREAAELFNTKHYDNVCDALEVFENDPLKQKPGFDFLYTTWGYVTLGCVMQGASGEDFRSLIRKLVFDPAGMTHTRDDDPRAIIPHRARGYIWENEELHNSRSVDMSSKMGAGGFVTTVGDLLKFMNAFMDGRLVSAKTMKEMLTPYRVSEGTVDNFGMGWFFYEYRGTQVVVFGGETPQVSGFIWFLPSKRLAIAGIFDIEDIPGSERGKLVSSISDVVLGEEKSRGVPGKKVSGTR
jgi:CubicO group peptidase (beta-lactamase class C family)